MERDENDGDLYPSTLAKALAMIETWEEVNMSSSPNQITLDESSLVYNAECYELNNQGGRGGRGGRDGRDTGRGGRGGRG